jgi:hypothetical protein
MSEREINAIYTEAVNEAFARLLWNARKFDRPIAPKAFKQVKAAHRFGVLAGILWQLRRNQAAGKPSA